MRVFTLNATETTSDSAKFDPVASFFMRSISSSCAGVVEGILFKAFVTVVLYPSALRLNDGATMCRKARKDTAAFAAVLEEEAEIMDFIQLNYVRSYVRLFGSGYTSGYTSHTIGLTLFSLYTGEVTGTAATTSGRLYLIWAT